MTISILLTAAADACVVTADNADQLRDGLVGDWYAARAGGDDVLMVAARRSTVADLNDRAREPLAARVELGEEVLDAGGLRFTVGDDVLAPAQRLPPRCAQRHQGHGGVGHQGRAEGRPRPRAERGCSRRLHRRRSPHARVRGDGPQGPGRDL
jgi:hypothetical protein